MLRPVSPLFQERARQLGDKAIHFIQNLPRLSRPYQIRVKFKYEETGKFRDIIDNFYVALGLFGSGMGTGWRVKQHRIWRKPAIFWNGADICTRAVVVCQPQRKQYHGASSAVIGYLVLCPFGLSGALLSGLSFAIPMVGTAVFGGLPLCHRYCNWLFPWVSREQRIITHL